MTTKLPSFQFYPGDWRKHPDLARATKAEKGMLTDILCLMWESEERGVLATAGIPWSDQEIVFAVGGDSAENLVLLQALLRKRILHRNNSAAIFSPRMVREEAIRQKCIESGKQGGNPNLVKGGVKGGVKGNANPKPTPSSSSSSSSSKIYPPNPPKGDSAEFFAKNKYSPTEKAGETMRQSGDVITVSPPGRKNKNGLYNPPELRDVVLYLNAKAGRHFDPDQSAFAGFLNARAKEGATAELMRQVVEKKIWDWRDRWKEKDRPPGQIDMSPWLRPETLFNAKKFWGYVEEVVTRKISDNIRAQKQREYANVGIAATAKSEKISEETWQESQRKINALKDKHGRLWWKFYNDATAKN